VRNLLAVRIPAFVVIALSAAALAGCGGSSGPTTTTAATTTEAAAPGPQTVLGAGSRALYAGGDWAVVVRGPRVAVAHRIAGRWLLDKTNAVRIDILGPHGVVAAVSQAAVELRGTGPLVESAIWVDGKELDVKGGGLKPNRGTIYSATPKLAPGLHRAVGYGRTDTGGGAVTWTFSVR
jgi:hypothetical protein